MKDGLFGVVSYAYLYKLSELIFIVWMRLYRPPPCGTRKQVEERNNQMIIHTLNAVFVSGLNGRR